MDDIEMCYNLEGSLHANGFYECNGYKLNSIVCKEKSFSTVFDLRVL